MAILWIVCYQHITMLYKYKVAMKDVSNWQRVWEIFLTHIKIDLFMLPPKCRFYCKVKGVFMFLAAVILFSIWIIFIIVCEWCKISHLCLKEWECDIYVSVSYHRSHVFSCAGNKSMN